MQKTSERQTMKKKAFGSHRSPARALVSVTLLVAAAPGWAQLAPPLTGTVASEPNPYYLGVRQAFTHESNVNRSPNGRSDNYSTTSLFGGFDQPIGRQRVFGRAAVGLNRYQKEDQLDNTSYDVSAGLDWSTIERLSGNLNVAFSQSLAAPAVIGVVPDQRRNIATTQSIDAAVRWGGASLLTLEGRAGYSNIDYSLPEYQSSESKQSRASIGLYYRPGGPLRLGVAARFTRAESPASGPNVTPAVLANTAESRNLDFTANYDVSGQVSAGGRISYTRQTNSAITAADFSGLTGDLTVGYRPTGKLTFNLYAARDVGSNSNQFTTTQSFLVGTTLITTRRTEVVEVSQVTNSAGLGVAYAATGKVTANAGVRYARAKLVSQTVADSTDVLKSAYLGANWEVARNVLVACNLARDERDVSGSVNYSYTSTSVGCLAQYTWP
jgi:hypothetical protein